DPVYTVQIGVPFNNYGTLADQQNTLRLGAGGDAYTGFAGSTITGAAGTTIVFGGPTALAAGSTLVTARAAQFPPPLGAGVSVAGSYTAAATFAGFSYSSPAIDPVVLTGPVGELGDVTVGNGVLDIAGAILTPAARTLGSLHVEDGTLRAAGD